MMKKWSAPAIEELDIRETANGLAPDSSFDDVWVQIGDKWYRPGHGES